MAEHARGVVVVTGGSAGLGRAISRAFAGVGYDVAVLARGADGLAATVDEVEQAGRRGLGIPCDVGDHEQVDAAAARVEQELGPVTVWVNNAMGGLFAPFTEVSPEEFERATRTTYLGQVNGTRAALRHMKPRDAGVVIQIGSALAYRGIPLQAAYCGAKHAVVGFTESVITELRHERSAVRVAMVHLPAMNTPQFNWVLNRLPQHPQPVAPIYQPEVAARAVVHLAAHPRSRMWVGESTFGTILGNRVAAGLLDRYLARTGYDGQQTDTAPRPEIGDNLWHPVEGDQGAHGDFDDRALSHSPVTWVSMHRKTAVGAMAAALAATAGVLTSARRAGRG